VIAATAGAIAHQDTAAWLGAGLGRCLWHGEKSNARQV